MPDTEGHICELGGRMFHGDVWSKYFTPRVVGPRTHCQDGGGCRYVGAV